MLEHLDRLDGSIQRVQDVAEFMKCRRERRRSFDGTLEPDQGLVDQPGLPQGDGELRLDFRVMAGACRLLKRRYGFLRPGLHEQRVAEELGRFRMPCVCL